MTALRYIIRLPVVFLLGVLSFFLLLVAVFGLLCLCALGFVCVLFLAWTVVHLAMYLTLHDRAAGQHAVTSILISAGCFGFIVVAWSTVFDLFRVGRRANPLRLELR